MEFRTALEEIVLEFQRKEIAAKFQYTTLKGSVAYYNHQLDLAKNQYELIRTLNNYIIALYENAIAKQKINEMEDKK